jgi:hypothetical protein
MLPEVIVSNLATENERWRAKGSHSLRCTRFRNAAALSASSTTALSWGRVPPRLHIHDVAIHISDIVTPIMIGNSCGTCRQGCHRHRQCADPAEVQVAARHVSAVDRDRVRDEPARGPTLYERSFRLWRHIRASMQRSPQDSATPAGGRNKVRPHREWLEKFLKNLTGMGLRQIKN